MGQYWKMINVDRGQRLPEDSSCGVNMPAILLNGSAGEELMKRLTVPSFKDTTVSELGLQRSRRAK